RLFVVLAKVARCVKKLFWNDGRLELYVAQRVQHRVAARTGDAGAARAEVGDVVESFARRLQAGISAAEQRPHVGWDKGIGHAVENGLALDVAQVERASSVQIDNLLAANQRPNAGLARSVFEGHKFHRSLPTGECNLKFY